MEAEFWFDTELYSWKEANSVCQTYGGHPQSVKSQEEFLISFKQNLGYLNTWLGATNEEDGETWQWADGSEWNYTNWAEGEPSYMGNCATFNYDGTWKVIFCDKIKRVLCKSLVGSYVVKGNNNISLVYRTDQLKSSQFKLKWTFESIDSQTTGQMQGVSLHWRVDPPYSVKAKPFTLLSWKNRNLIALVNLVNRAKSEATLQEIWAAVVHAKLSNKDKYRCIGNILEFDPVVASLGKQSEGSVVQLIIGQAAKTLNVQGLRYNPVSQIDNRNEKNIEISDSDLQTGLDMLAFVLYCPLNSSPYLCATGSKDCTWCYDLNDCKQQNVYLDSFNREMENLGFFTYFINMLAKHSAGTLIQSVAALLNRDNGHNTDGIIQLYNTVLYHYNLTFGKVPVARGNPSNLKS